MARQRLLIFQRNEITEHHVYAAFSRRAQGANRDLLARISADELRHYEQFRSFTGCDVAPNRLKIAFYRLCARVFGFTFGIRLMERGEKHAQEAYRHFGDSLPSMVQTMEEENRHERMLIDMIDEERLKYMGSMVLALNNSIQEFSGIAAGLTFALQTNTQVIGVTVLISGLAATLAMSASEYLSQKAEAQPADGPRRQPWKAVLYAGGIYLFIVLTIVAPYFLLGAAHAALAVALGGVGLILAVFTFFMAVVKGLRYRTVLLEALGVALVVVVASFLIGTAARGLFDLGGH
ncbi:MAG: VIT1/CCC1 family protein [Planctomycetes bacterium]|jgi:VIT1/CCC1 family predicted Fe2+/Mn2+ transporter|nr:VIT1/CCC1 family protein [Planctomycetota bacterium]